MAFGRRSNTVPGGEKDGSDGLPPHIVRLITVMDRMFSDASHIVRLVRDGEPLPVPQAGLPFDGHIHCADFEKLFQHTDNNGELLFTTYHFTQNLKQIDPEAQYKLSELYQKAVMVNMLLNNAVGRDSPDIITLKSLLDAVLVKSAYFSNFFKSYAVVAAILGRTLDDQAQARALEKHAADWRNAMDRAISLMFDPSRINALTPHPHVSLVVAASGPYQEGQRVINGVVFAPELAKVLMAKLAREQAQAMAHSG